MSPYRTPAEVSDHDVLRWPGRLRSRAALILFAGAVVAAASLCAAPLLSSAPEIPWDDPPATAGAHPMPAPPSAPAHALIHEDEGVQCDEGYRNFALTGRVEMSCTGIPSIRVLAYARDHDERVLVSRRAETCVASLGRENEIGFECPAKRVDELDGDFAGLVIPPNPFRGVSDGVPAVTGPVAPEVIRRFVRLDIVPFRACYGEALRRNSKLAGSIATRFVIEQGAATGAENAASSISDAALVACVTDAFSKLDFPQAGAPTTVVYPIDFAPP